jgi:hypothetical protein
MNSGSSRMLLLGLIQIIGLALPGLPGASAS